MKIIQFLLAGFLLLFYGCDTVVNITSSEKDAKIFVNGNYSGQGSESVSIKDKDCATVRVEKEGYLTDEVTYCVNVQGHPRPPGRDYYELQKDESYDASEKNDNANHDMSVVVSKKFSEAQAWKIVHQIVTEYYDEIKTESPETGYLVTAWKVQTFKQVTIRTRIVIKTSSSSPLTYSIKVASERAEGDNVSLQDDQKFKEWDRLLKKFQEIIGVFQSRLADK